MVPSACCASTLGFGETGGTQLISEDLLGEKTLLTVFDTAETTFPKNDETAENIDAVKSCPNHFALAALGKDAMNVPMSTAAIMVFI